MEEKNLPDTNKSPAKKQRLEEVGIPEIPEEERDAVPSDEVALAQLLESAAASDELLVEEKQDDDVDEKNKKRPPSEKENSSPSKKLALESSEVPEPLPEENAEVNSEGEPSGESLGSESDAGSENEVDYEKLKTMASESDSFDQRTFYWLFYNTTQGQLIEILTIGKQNHAFDSVWENNAPARIEKHEIYETHYQTLGGLLLSDEFDESKQFNSRFTSGDDEAVALQLETLLDHWPFIESVSSLLSNPDYEGETLEELDDAQEYWYEYGDDIVATFIAKNMTRCLTVALDALSDRKGKGPFDLRCSIQRSDNEEVLSIRLVEVAILAKSHTCLVVLLKRGFNPNFSLRLCNINEELPERIEFFKWAQQLFAISSSRLTSSTMRKLRRNLGEAIFIKLKNPEESIVQLKLSLRQGRNFIRNKSYIDEDLLALHALCHAVLKLPDSNIDATLLDPPKKIEKAMFTFIRGTAYQLPNALPARMQNTLITTLLYRCVRYRSLSLETIRTIDTKVDILVAILIKFDEQFKEFKLEDFKKEIEAQEKQSHDFFADDLSDDSDDERKEEYNRWDDRQKLFTSQYAQHLIFKTNLIELVEKKDPPTLRNFLSKTKRGDNKGKTAVSKEGIPRFRQIGPFSPFERQKFFGCTEITPANLHNFAPLLVSKLNTVSELERQKQDDLNMINFYVAKDQIDVLQKKLANGEIKTKFIICQYRGIHYNTASWTASARRAHRKANEKGQPQFSSSISEHSREEQKLPKAKEEAERIRLFKQTHKELFCELQAFYTNYYDKFHLLLHYVISGPPLTQQAWKKALGKKQNADELAEKFMRIQSVLREYLSHPENPFVSTGDLPFHALRYAYGLKSYPGHQDERLRPRWNTEGRAERPYSGKFYVSAYTLEEYLTQPANHVFSMHTTGEIVALSTNKAERETSFFSYQPGKNIVYQHVAKYPSFNGDFHDLFEYKYGLNKELFRIFKESLKTARPHSDENWNAKALLGELLCAYQEAVTLDFMRSYALKQGAVLIYRSRWGTFEFTPSNIHSEKEEKAKETGSWINTFNQLIETRKKVFNKQPQKELIDAMLCEDSKRVEALLQNIESIAELDEMVAIPEYKTEDGIPPKSYCVATIAASKAASKKDSVLERMVSAKRRELEQQDNAKPVLGR